MNHQGTGLAGKTRKWITVAALANVTEVSVAAAGISPHLLAALGFAPVTTL